MNLNKGLFDAFGSSSVLTSPTTGKATATNSQASQLRGRLDTLLPVENAVIVDPTLPNEGKVTSCQLALLNYGVGANNLNAHVQTRLTSFMDDMQVASAVKEIDGYLNDASSCANINTIAGTMAGATDTILDGTTDILNELDAGITAFDNGSMDKPDFETLLDRVTTELGSNVVAMAGMIANEVAMVQTMYTTHMKMAKSFQAEALINDPCVRPFLVQMAGPELSQVLVDDFGVEDLANL